MSITSKRNTINKEGRPKVMIPSDIFGNFYLLHTKFKGLEWSGYIYYDIIGNIDDPNNMIFKVSDFVLLDIGSSGFTSIEPTGEQIVNIFTQRPHLMGKPSGCLHTHHHMGLFFSGTDTDTLLESASQFDLFLSVIVNHRDNPIAKVSQAGVIEAIETYKYKLQGTQFVKEPVISTKEVICVWDCDVVIDDNLIKSDLETCQKIYDEKRIKTAESYKNYLPANYFPNIGFKGNSGFSNKHNTQIGLFDDVEEINPNYINMSIKDKSIELLKMCLLQMSYIEDGYTLAFCREEYYTSKKEMDYSLQDLREETIDCLEEFIETLFTKEELSKVNNIKDITTHLDIIKDDKSDDECLIVSIIKDYLSNGHKHTNKV